MARKRFSPRATNIRSRMTLDPKSLQEFERAMKRLESAVRKDVIRQALQGGGEVISDAANGMAPGPHVIVVVMTGAELMRGWKSASPQGIKPEALYAVIGPDAAHWYYRFPEYGVKPHGVTRRKRTRYQQYAAKNKIKRSTLTSVSATGKKRNVSRTTPKMMWMNGSTPIFARRVSGYGARPFLRPATDSKGKSALDTVGKVLGAEIEKAGKG
jgi:hypothetical protein